MRFHDEWLPSIQLFLRALRNEDPAAANALQAMVEQMPDSGTYTPTSPDNTNCDSVTPGLAFFMRVRNVVIVGGSFVADPTAASTTTRVSLSAPPSAESAIGAIGDAAGICIKTATFNTGVVFGDVSEQTVEAVYTSQGTAAETFFYVYLYRIV